MRVTEQVLYIQCRLHLPHFLVSLVISESSVSLDIHNLDCLGMEHLTVYTELTHPRESRIFVVLSFLL